MLGDGTPPRQIAHQIAVSAAIVTVGRNRHQLPRRPQSPPPRPPSRSRARSPTRSPALSRTRSQVRPPPRGPLVPPPGHWPAAYGRARGRTAGAPVRLTVQTKSSPPPCRRKASTPSGASSQVTVVARAERRLLAGAARAPCGTAPAWSPGRRSAPRRSARPSSAGCGSQLGPPSRGPKPYGGSVARPRDRHPAAVAEAVLARPRGRRTGPAAPRPAGRCTSGRPSSSPW